MDPLDILSNYLINAEESNCGTGAGGFKKGNTCAAGSDMPVGQRVTITGGRFEGKKGVIERFNTGAKGQAFVALYKGNKVSPLKVFVEHDHLKAEGGVDQAHARRLQAAREEEDDLDSGESEKLALEAKVQAGQKTPIRGATKYTLSQLNDAARKAGEALFASSPSGLVRDRATEVRYRKLSDLKKVGAALDDFEYVFKPSTGKGIDVASAPWKQAKTSWADNDGKIYTQVERTIYVTELNF